MAEFRLKIAIIFLSTQVHGRAPHGFCARRDLVTGPLDGLLRPAVFVRMGPAGVDPRPVQPEPEVKLELVEFQFLFFLLRRQHLLELCVFFFVCSKVSFSVFFFADLYKKIQQHGGKSPPSSRVVGDVRAPVEQVDDQEEQREYNAGDLINFRHGVHLDVVTVASDHFVVGLPVVGRSHLSLGRIPAASGTLKLNASFVLACGQVTVNAVDLRDVHLFPS